MKKFLLLLLVLSFPVLFLGADEKKHDTDSIRKPEIESLDISPNPVGRGDLFTITIVVDHNNSAEVDFPLDDLPEFLQLWRGPYIRSFIDTDKNDESVRKVRITTTFKARRSGRMIIPSLKVVADSHEMNTEPRLLRVGLYKNRKLYMPIETEWQAGFEKIYAGEAVPVSLMVRNQEVVVIFDRTRVAFPRDGFFEKVGGIADITTMTNGDVVLYDIPAATYIYTSPVAGEVKIPSAGVDYDGISGWTDNLFLKISRTPSEIKTTGAVGDFDYRASIETGSIEAGDSFTLTGIVEGHGNLNFLKLPEPEVEGCILLSTEEVSDYQASSRGFSGSKTVRWIYSAEEPGTLVLRIPDFVYLDKETDQVLSIAGAEYRLAVTAVSDDKVEEETSAVVIQKIAVSDNSMPVWRNYYRSWYRYIWFLPGCIFFVFVLIMKGRRLPLALILSVIISVSVFSAGRFILRDRIDAEVSALGSEVLYNDAADAYEAGRVTDCLHNLRTAVYNDPVNSMYRETLKMVEVEYGFINAVSPSVKLHPDIFFYLLMISLNLFFISLVFRIVRPGGAVSVLIILFGFSILFSSVMIAYSHVSRNNLTAIVSQDGSFLKKIPQATAGEWIPVRAGTALNVIERSEQFVLVETGLGVKGWIEEDNLLKDRITGEF